MEFQKAQVGPPFTVLITLRCLSLRYSTNFCRSRLVKKRFTQFLFLFCHRFRKPICHSILKTKKMLTISVFKRYIFCKNNIVEARFTSP